MIKYILKRLLLMIPVMIGVVTIVFILNALTPGDVAKDLAGQDATQEQVEALREDLGLNKPLIVQYATYIWRLFTKGDFGTSYVTHQPILNEILARYPTTIKLALLSSLLAACIGIPLGVIAAVKQYTWIDNTAMVISLAGVSVPNFWLGLMSILLFSVRLGWLPATGLEDGLKSWIMPMFVCGIGTAATIARVTRSSLLEVIRQDYIRTARAKGQKEFVVIVRHALRNSLIPVVTLIGSQIGHALGGAVLVESVFGISGLGGYMVAAIKARNFPAVQGGVVFLSLVFSLINLLVDILYTYIDPQLKTRYSAKRSKRKSPVQKKETALGGE